MRLLYAARKALGVLLSFNKLQRNALDSYVTSYPLPQNAVDIFPGGWASRFPPPLEGLKAGQSPLFEDERINWFAQQIGGFEQQSVLELGPLEAGHSYMLERLGAARILGIEANTQAFLKCLIVKELLGLQRTKFICGDFLEFLRGAPATEMFDVCLASGVLYHMQNPVELIACLADRCSRHLLLWTHYYDAEAIGKSSRLASKFSAAKPAVFRDFPHQLYRQEYGATLFHRGFCGGSAPSSHWISKADILGALSFFGFADLRVADQPDHPNGPAFSVAATRKSAG